MSTRPFVSVVIPFFNNARYFREAVDSVFAQTYDHWELIFVDDGATDETPGMARDYMARHPDRVRYVEHPGRANRGASASRNLGAREARGVYVSFLDADDAWLPGKLEQQVRALEAHPEAGWTYGRGLWWYGWTGRPEDQRDFVQELGVPAEALVPYPSIIGAYLRDEDTVPSSFAIMARRELLAGVGGGSEENWRSVYDDQVAFAKLALVRPAFVQNDVQYRYRQHAESRVAMTLRAGEYFTIRLPYLEWLRDYLNAHGGDDPELLGELERQFGPSLVANGRVEEGTPKLVKVLSDPSVASATVKRVGEAIVDGALRSTAVPPHAFVDRVFAGLPRTGSLRDLHRKVLGDVHLELAFRNHRNGRMSDARHHAWAAIRADRALMRHGFVIRIGMERLIGTRVTDTIRHLLKPSSERRSSN